MTERSSLSKSKNMSTKIVFTQNPNSETDRQCHAIRNRFQQHRKGALLQPKLTLLNPFGSIKDRRVHMMSFGAFTTIITPCGTNVLDPPTRTSMVTDRKKNGGHSKVKHTRNTRQNLIFKL